MLKKIDVFLKQRGYSNMIFEYIQGACFSLVLLASISMTEAYMVYNGYKNESTTLHCSDGNALQTNNNILYVGRSQLYYFLYNKSEKTAIIVKADEIHKIELKSSKWSLVIWLWKTREHNSSLIKVIYGLDRKELQLAEMERQEKISWAIYFVSGIVATFFILAAGFIIRNQRHRMRRESETRVREEAIIKTQQELLEIDLNNKKLQAEQLKESVHNKAREITVHTLQSIQKNQLLEDIGVTLKEMIKSDGRSYKKELRSLLNKINQNFHKDNYWEDFRRIFEEINQDFFDKLQQINPGLSATEIKFISLIKLNMNGKDIAALLGVSSDSLRVSRYRLRKKLKLEQGCSLTAFIQSI